MIDKRTIKLIEKDDFPFEFLSELANRESWRKEIYRPVNYLHKWWAKRLGSVFRGILLGCVLSEQDNLSTEFYKQHSFDNIVVFDPFMGSGTTIGEAHKLGFTALGRDINPVATETTRVALGPMNLDKIIEAYAKLSNEVGNEILKLYCSVDSDGFPCEVLYYFWVMQVPCIACGEDVPLFPSWVISKNAYPKRKPEIQILCPFCGNIFPGTYGIDGVVCDSCRRGFSCASGNTSGSIGICQHCNHRFKIIDAIDISGTRPVFHLYGKLVVNHKGEKEYLPATIADQLAYKYCSEKLKEEIHNGNIVIPELELKDGYNTQQAMKYNFLKWSDLFNDRQLLALGWLQAAILRIEDQITRDILLTLFSGSLEFNNMFASYKGEGTGAVRHMFYHHILKPERTPIEANVWGTPKSSGSFSNLFRSRLLRAIDYRNSPTEIPKHKGEKLVVASPPYSGKVQSEWPVDGSYIPRTISISCGDSSKTHLKEKSIDLIVTDPPFFDNVHYSELADFFYAWHQLNPSRTFNSLTTRNEFEVQNSDSQEFTKRLTTVFLECYRVLKDEGILVFTYHHSKKEGWESLAKALLDANLKVVNSHPVKSEMSVAIPKSQTKDPIQLDIIIVCHKNTISKKPSLNNMEKLVHSSIAKIQRLEQIGLKLSHNDCRMILFGQLLTILDEDLIQNMPHLIEESLSILNYQIQSQHQTDNVNRKKLSL